MSVERSFESWEVMQRHGQDWVGKLAEGFTGLIQSRITQSPFLWPATAKLFDVEFEFPSHNFLAREFGVDIDNHGINGVGAILDMGGKIGQAGADLGACLNGLVQQFFRSIPIPFMQGENDKGLAKVHHTEIGGQGRQRIVVAGKELDSLAEQLGNLRFCEDDDAIDGVAEDELSGFNLKIAGLFGRSRV